MNIKLVEAFALIMRTGTLAKAEAQTGISKATLSRQLQRLEEQLGAQLLLRTSRGFVPTDAGRAFLAHCDAMLTDASARLEAASTEVREMSLGAGGGLCILSDNQFMTSFVTHVTKIFLKRFPDVECELHVAGRPDSPNVEEVDCYVCSEAPDRPNVIGKLIGRLSYGLYASPAYMAREGLPLTPKDLSKHASVRLRDPDFVKVVLHAENSSHPYLSRSTLQTNDYWVLKTFCIDGMGIALLPDFFAQPEVNHGSLVPVLPEWKPERRRVYCAYQRQRCIGKKLRAFIDLVSTSVADIDTVHTYIASSSGKRVSTSPRCA